MEAWLGVGVAVVDIGYREAPSSIEMLVNLFRSNLPLVRTLVSKIRSLTLEVRKRYGGDSRFRIMDFCGTHEWTITHFGIRSLMPPAIELV
ncbi:MAG: hypothetical protein QXL19_04130, partial [Ignisphaera sp.]